MAVMELLVTQLSNAQLVINRWHYVSTGTPAAVSLSFALLSASGFLEATGSPPRFPANTLGRAIQGMQTASTLFVSAYARDLYSTTDFYETPYATTTVGENTGEANAPFVAMGYRTNRVRTDVRRGTKRFAGIPEAAFGDLGVLAPAFVATANLVSTRMSDVLSYDDEGNTISFSPAVLGVVEYTTPEGNRAYRRYPTVTEQLAHTATGVLWSVYNEARSQTSRQRGRGA